MKFDNSSFPAPKIALASYSAPAQRASRHDLDQALDSIAADALLQSFLSTVQGSYLILNPYWQVVAANPQVFTLLGTNDPSSLLGRRPGDIMGCIHATEGPAGCGTSPICQACGAAAAIWMSQQWNRPVVKEWLATVNRNSCFESMEFQVRVAPLTIQEQPFTALAFTDISSVKRRNVLEKILFQDTLNAAGGVMGYASLLVELDQAQDDLSTGRHVADKLLSISTGMVYGIQDHQKLLRAENHRLSLDIGTVTPFRVLEWVRQSVDWLFHERACRLEIVSAPKDQPFKTDIRLLRRVLINMTENALEASRRGETIRIGYELSRGSPSFWVHNPGWIPDKIVPQIFKRAFSTKGPGRGIGTYCMRIFGERYLGGKVGFSTCQAKGTTFWIRLPADGPDPSRFKKRAEDDSFRSSMDHLQI